MPFLKATRSYATAYNNYLRFVYDILYPAANNLALLAIVSN
jgi:hypothetical protein